MLARLTQSVARLGLRSAVHRLNIRAGHHLSLVFSYMDDERMSTV